MSTKIINGIAYDFERCTKEQLATYVADFLGLGSKHFRETGNSVHTSGNIVLAAARIETKADVALELAELCNKNFEPVFRNQNFDVVLTPTAADEFRALVGRYRKAVDS